MGILILQSSTWAIWFCDVTIRGMYFGGTENGLNAH